jgi:hypothetical protein
MIQDSCKSEAVRLYIWWAPCADLSGLLLFLVAATAAALVAAGVWYIDGLCWAFEVALQWQLEQACLQGTGQTTES